MYGIINQSIQDLFVKNFGEETWLKILEGESMLVEYRPQRAGFTAMMDRMLHGIVKMFKETAINVALEPKKINNGQDHDLFRIEWKK